MNLDHVIITSILNYPILYKFPTYEMSRLAVLDHIFLVIGNGMEWYKGKFLTYINYETGELITEAKLKKRFPKGYFQKKLWYIEVKEESLRELKVLFKGRYYFVEERRSENPTIYFEGEMEEARMLSFRYGEFFKKLYTTMDSCRPFDAEREGEVRPYPICEYSAIYELAEGKTNELSQEEFELTSVDPQWIAGGLEIARYSLGMYLNPEKHHLLPYHPHEEGLNPLRGWENDWNQAVKAGTLDKWKEEREFPPTISTPLEAATFSWKRFKNEQIAILQKFISKYGNQ